jgi:hypothetical protein
LHKQNVPANASKVLPFSSMVTLQTTHKQGYQAGLRLAFPVVSETNLFRLSCCIINTILIPAPTNIATTQSADKENLVSSDWKSNKSNGDILLTPTNKETADKSINPSSKYLFFIIAVPNISIILSFSF